MYTYIYIYIYICIYIYGLHTAPSCRKESEDESSLAASRPSPLRGEHKGREAMTLAAIIYTNR